MPSSAKYPSLVADEERVERHRLRQRLQKVDRDRLGGCRFGALGRSGLYQERSRDHDPTDQPPHPPCVELHACIPFCCLRERSPRFASRSSWVQKTTLRSMISISP